MRIIKYLIKKIGYFYLKIILIDREKMLSIKKNNYKVLKEEYAYSPERKEIKDCICRYSDKPNPLVISPFFLCNIKDVTLIGPYGIPVTSGGKILQETTQDAVFKYILRTISSIGFVAFVKEYLSVFLPFKKYDLNSGLHLVPRHGYSADSPNYCHWLLEDLPKLFAYDYINEETKIITNKTLTKFQIDSLKLMEFSENDIYLHDKDATYVRSFFVTNMRTAQSIDSERDPIGRNWVANKIKSNVVTSSNKKRKKRIFISRQDLRLKYITNMHEVENVLNRFNIDIFYAGKKNLADDIKIFADTDLLIVPRGAGLTNMIFTENCHIIEIAHYTLWEKNFFHSTALEFNCSFDSVEAMRDIDFENNSEIREAWHVDPVLLENAIKRTPNIDQNYDS